MIPYYSLLQHNLGTKTYSTISDEFSEPSDQLETKIDISLQKINRNSFNMGLRQLDNVHEVCPPVKLNEVKQESCIKAYYSNISMLP